jgi:CheY-like chemotaxis protein
MALDNVRDRLRLLHDVQASSRPRWWTGCTRFALKCLRRGSAMVLEGADRGRRNAGARALRTLLGDCTAPQVPWAPRPANAAQALALLQHEPFDAVLLDIHMPVPTAWPGPRCAGVPRPAVVFITAHAEHAVQAFEMEAVDYLTKPVRLERLQLALQKVQRLAAASARRQPGRCRSPG